MSLPDSQDRNRSYVEHHFRPSAEELEQRRLLATASFSGGVLTITGDSVANDLEVTVDESVVKVTDHLGTPTTDVSTGGDVDPKDVTKIVVNTNDGDNTVDLRAVTSGNGFTKSPPAVVTAGTENDTVWGTEFNDTIIGDLGEDELYGEDGNDRIFADDEVEDDDLWTPQEITDCQSALQHESFEPDPNTLSGGEGDDIVVGGGDDDDLSGGDGNDLIIGWDGDDTLYGGEGSDNLRAGDDADHLYPGLDDDDDNDDDHLCGWGGDDMYYFNSTNYGGTDTIEEYSDTGVDEITFAGMHTAVELSINNISSAQPYLGGNEDFINLDAGGSTQRFEKLRGSGYDDTLTGNAGKNTLWGGAGDDTIRGLGDDDVIYGQSGDDTIDGGSGDDTLYGGSDDDLIRGEAGTDSILGEDGNDTVYGGDGTDRIWGGDDRDMLYGDAGDDTMYGGDGDDTLFGGSGTGDYGYGENGTDELSMDIEFPFQ